MHGKTDLLSDRGLTKRLEVIPAAAHLRPRQNADRVRLLLTTLAAASAVLLPMPPGSLAQTEDASESPSLLLELEDKAAAVAEGVEDEAAKLTKEAIESSERLLRTLREDYSPVVRAAGFEISQVRATIDLPPGMTIRVRRIESLSRQKQEDLLEKHGEDKLLAGVLTVLFAIDSLDLEGYELKEAQIASGLPPKVTLILEPIGDK